jgi:hypothetical protein
MRLPASLFVLALACCAQAAQAADYARERRWADEILPLLVVGAPVWLDAGRVRFLGLYAPVETGHAAVLLLHGKGMHPDWGPTGMLRVALADRRFATLAIQLPVNGAEVPAEAYADSLHEAAGRIGASIDWLRAKGYARVFVVSFSLGSRMMNEYIRLNPRSRVEGWVCIGLSGPFEAFEPVSFPVLDLYGGADLPAVRAAAPARAAALQGRPLSRQIALEGADHFFTGRDADLTRAVEAWLLHTLAPK